MSNGRSMKSGAGAADSSKAACARCGRGFDKGDREYAVASGRYYCSGSRLEECVTLADGTWRGWEPMGGYDKVPGEFLELCMSMNGKHPKISGTVQLGVIAYIIENTVCAKPVRGERPAACKINLKTVAAKLGCGKEDGGIGGVKIALQDAVNRGLIERKQDAEDGRTSVFRICPWNWATAPDYVPRSVKKDAEEDERDAAAVEDTTAAAASRKPAGAPWIVRPGKERSIKLDNPVQKLTYENVSSFPIRCETFYDDSGGALITRIHDEAAEGKKPAALEDRATGVAAFRAAGAGDRVTGVAGSARAPSGDRVTGVARSGNAFVDNSGTYPTTKRALPATTTTRARDSFDEFLAVATDAGIDGGRVDWEAARKEWGRLDSASRIACIQGIRERVEAGATDDPVLKSLPQNILAGRKWERKIRAMSAPNGGGRNGGNRPAGEELLRRIAAGELEDFPS